MKISEILSGEFIIPELEGKEKVSIISELATFLEEKGIIRDRANLTQALMERERLGSTGIGENVAIPHAKFDEVDRIFTLFARSSQGVDFESLDQRPVHFVCLVIAPGNSTGQHLKALARISRLLKSQKLRDGILNAHDAKDIYSVILEEDAQFI